MSLPMSLPMSLLMSLPASQISPHVTIAEAVRREQDLLRLQEELTCPVTHKLLEVSFLWFRIYAYDRSWHSIHRGLGSMVSDLGLQ